MERTRQLEKDNTELTKELERAIDQNTRMCQTVIQLETSRDKLKSKLRAFKQDTGYDALLCRSLRQELWYLGHTPPYTEGSRWGHRSSV